jgi:hypothetical protein
MTPMRARRDEAIWSTDAAAGHCRAVKPKADSVLEGRASPIPQEGTVQRVGPYLCVVLGTALGYLCGYLWRVL